MLLNQSSKISTINFGFQPIKTDQSELKFNYVINGLNNRLVPQNLAGQWKNELHVPMPLTLDLIKNEKYYKHLKKYFIFLNESDWEKATNTHLKIPLDYV